MSTIQETDPDVDSRWPLAAATGGVAGLLRPLGVTVMEAAGIDPGIVAMTIQPDLPMWWLVHLVYSFAFGAVYGGLAFRGRLRAYVGAPATGVLVGAGYGVALWVVNVLVVWEVLLATFVPLVHTDGSVVGPLIGHVVYGVVLGAAYPLARSYA